MGVSPGLRGLQVAATLARDSLQSFQGAAELDELNNATEQWLSTPLGGLVALVLAAVLRTILADMHNRRRRRHAPKRKEQHRDTVESPVVDSRAR